jgi:hypothetical protein
MANECLDSYNERATVVLVVTFTDDDGALVTPTAATYRVDDEASRTSIVPVTAISPLDDTVELKITSDQNYIVRPRNKQEIRTVTVEFDYGSGDHATGVYKYKLVNLYGVVDVASASVSPSASASPSA